VPSGSGGERRRHWRRCRRWGFVVDASETVTATLVQFLNDRAIGGAGGDGGSDWHRQLGRRWRQCGWVGRLTSRPIDPHTRDLVADSAVEGVGGAGSLNDTWWRRRGNGGNGGDATGGALENTNTVTLFNAVFNGNVALAGAGGIGGVPMRMMVRLAATCWKWRGNATGGAIDSTVSLIINAAFVHRQQSHGRQRWNGWRGGANVLY